MQTRMYRAVIRGLSYSFLVLLAFAITAFPSAAAPRPATLDFAAIDAYVQSEMAAIGLPGVAFGIVQRNQIIHLQGLGVADPTGRAVTPQTPFLIGSMAKSFTALAIMQLVEDGKIELDAPVQRYLPWFRVADAGESAQITVRHLLNQTSGLPTAPGLEYLVRKDTSDGALEHDVRAIQNVALSSPPGQVYQYCNLNFSTLGLIVQTVAGQPYEQYIQRHILAPLGMRNSFASPEDAQRNGLATGYQFWFGRPVPSSLSYNRAAIPAGYISASAEDMARYAIAQLNGGRYDRAAILSPAGMDKLHRPAVVAQNPFSFYSDSRYAMGWVASQTNGVPSIWHNGDLLDFHAHVILVPDGQWGIVLLTNGQNELQGARIERIGVGVMSLLLGREPPPLESSLLMTILVIGLGACALQILGIARSMILLRRWRITPARRPRGAVGMMLRVGLPLALSLLWAFVTLLIVPQVLETPLTLLVYNDYSLVVVLSGVVGLVWGILRAMLAFWVLRTTSAQQATAALVSA